MKRRRIGAVEANVPENKILRQSSMIKHIMIGLLAIVFYLMIFQQKEGFTVGNTPTDVETSVKTAADTLYGNLNVPTYKSNYLTLTDEVVRWTDYSMMMLLIDKKIGSEDYMANVQKFNDLSTFKQNVLEFNKTVSSFS